MINYFIDLDKSNIINKFQSNGVMKSIESISQIIDGLSIKKTKTK